MAASAAGAGCLVLLSASYSGCFGREWISGLSLRHENVLPSRNLNASAHGLEMPHEKRHLCEANTVRYMRVHVTIDEL